MSAPTGFSSAVDKQLALAADVDNCLEREKCTVVVIDEIYIKEDLVYNKHTGALVGFANLGETNNHVPQFERSLESDSSDALEPLAKPC